MSGAGVVVGKSSDGPALVLLDTCCLLNLYATGRIDDVLRGFPATFAVVERVAAEAIYIRRGGAGDDADERELVDLQPLLADGLVEILQFETEEETATFVQFAAELDDGEAMTCALAVHRGAVIATDDRKAHRLLKSGTLQIDPLTTAGLVKHWADSRGIAQPELKQTLSLVRERARFAPGKDDQLQTWWESALNQP